MNKFLPDICGFNKVSEIGDNVFAPSIFLGTCNFRCPYCMNSKLVYGTSERKVNLEDVKKFVEENGSEWLMISGGEPTCTPYFNLMVLLGEILSWGCKIGMSTNGSGKHTLFHISEYLNYVALDIKASNQEDYHMLSGHRDVYYTLLETLHVLRKTKENRKDFDFEIRTTLFPSVINEQSLAKIGSEIIKKDDKWVLQQFRHAQNMLDPSCNQIEPYSEEKVESLIGVAKQYCDNVRLRYV